MEFDARTAIKAEPVEVPAHLYEAPYQGYESWLTSELVVTARACMAELERRGELERTRISLRDRIRILLKGE